MFSESQLQIIAILGESVLPLLTLGAVSMRSNMLDFLCMQSMHKILGDLSCTALTCACQNETFPTWPSFDSFHKERKRNAPDSKAIPSDRTAFSF